MRFFNSTLGFVLATTTLLNSPQANADFRERVTKAENLGGGWVRVTVTARYSTYQKHFQATRNYMFTGSDGKPHCGFTISDNSPHGSEYFPVDKTADEHIKEMHEGKRAVPPGCKGYPSWTCEHQFRVDVGRENRGRHLTAGPNGGNPGMQARYQDAHRSLSHLESGPCMSAVPGPVWAMFNFFSSNDKVMVQVRTR